MVIFNQLVGFFYRLCVLITACSILFPRWTQAVWDQVHGPDKIGTLPSGLFIALIASSFWIVKGFRWYTNRLCPALHEHGDRIFDEVSRSWRSKAVHGWYGSWVRTKVTSGHSYRTLSDCLDEFLADSPALAQAVGDTTQLVQWAYIDGMSQFGYELRPMVLEYAANLPGWQVVAMDDCHVGIDRSMMRDALGLADVITCVPNTYLIWPDDPQPYRMMQGKLFARAFNLIACAYSDNDNESVQQAQARLTSQCLNASATGFFTQSGSTDAHDIEKYVMRECQTSISPVVASTPADEVMV